MRLAISVLVLCVLPVAGDTASGVDRIAWLQGCWTLTAEGRTVEEQWTSPRGGTMLGTGRTVKDGRLVEYEFVIIRERGDALVYEAHPSRQSPAEFVSTRVEDGVVVFENAQHDFPQRIGYRRVPSGLTAWVEGKAGGKTRKMEFPYERTDCPGN